MVLHVSPNKDGHGSPKRRLRGRRDFGVYGCVRRWWCHRLENCNIINPNVAPPHTIWEPGTMVQMVQLNQRLLFSLEGEVNYYWLLVVTVCFTYNDGTPTLQKFGNRRCLLVSLAAVFWMSRNAPPKKRLRGRLDCHVPGHVLYTSGTRSNNSHNFQR